MKVTRGVPLGSCLSPLLFNIYTRELPQTNDAKTIQFADDVTHSAADQSSQVIINKLSDAFVATKNYCLEHELIINTRKTQFIVFKAPTMKPPEVLEISLDNLNIQSSDFVKLLGVTLDRHFTFGQHMHNTVKKCNGLIGMLNRAASHLTRQLLLLAYVALIRSHLEYCSAIFASASKTQLLKLETVQKVASRVVCRAPRNSHSAPLLADLKINSLASRRTAHVRHIVETILSGNTHPALRDMFKLADDGTIANDQYGRTGLGRRRFSVYAKDIVNRQSE